MWRIAAGILIVALCVLLSVRADCVVNVVSYTVEPIRGSGAARYLIPGFAAGLAIRLAWRRQCSKTGVVCAIAAASAGCLLLAGAAPGLSPVSYAALAGSWAAMSAALVSLGRSACPDPPEFAGSAASVAPPRASRLPVVILGCAIIASTTWHAWMQVVQWRHFALGFADVGLFVVELENLLPWKPEAAGRFASTRMGFHCIPLFYALAPVYAVVRTPVLLMIVGPLALNAAAQPFFNLARARTGCAWTGLAAGLGWLALPSLSRLPHANTYGFQSIYLATPFVAAFVCLGLQGRRRASWTALVLAMLCEETVCGVAAGWGAYVALVQKRRREGACLVGVALAYLVLTTQGIIPAFAAEARYTRVDLFGDASVAAMASRLARPEAWAYMAALAAPLVAGWVRAPGLLIVAAPTLLLVLTMAEGSYLSIKYWHQTSVLPVLYATALAGWTTLRRRDGEATAPEFKIEVCERAAARATVVAGLAGILIAHQWLGFSPLAHAYSPMMAATGWDQPDARMNVVRLVHERFDPDTTHVVATERLAMHFTRYVTVRSTPGVDFDTTPAGRCVLVVDRSDTWDRTVSSGRIEALLEEASAAGFVSVMTQGSVEVFVRE
ncbi:MAG: hypothetical protein BroJett003_15370 [Planctomycetota bacterium]|nr:MAG: hypothetical protein BroJett003_15370 [Planctomycetota bacterium]